MVVSVHAQRFVDLGSAGGVPRIGSWPYEPIPVAKSPWRIPLIEPFLRVGSLLRDPPAQLAAYARELGSVYAYSIPFFDDIYYIFSPEGYRQFVDAPPEELSAGPIRALISTLNRWLPRSDRGTTYLERLVVHGREFIGSRLLEKSRVDAMESVIV